MVQTQNTVTEHILQYHHIFHITRIEQDEIWCDVYIIVLSEHCV